MTAGDSKITPSGGSIQGKNCKHDLQGFTPDYFEKIIYPFPFFI